MYMCVENVIFPPAYLKDKLLTACSFDSWMKFKFRLRPALIKQKASTAFKVMNYLYVHQCKAVTHQQLIYNIYIKIINQITKLDSHGSNPTLKYAFFSSFLYQDNQLLSHYLGQTCWEPKTVWTKCSAEDMSWPWASLQDSVTSLSLSRQTQPGTGLSVTTPLWFSISQLALPCKTTHRMQKCCDTFWFRKLYCCCYSTAQHLQCLMQHLMKRGLIIMYSAPCVQ